MKLEMQMTDRDKKLLIFLAVFVIVVGFGYWGVRPNINKIVSRNDDIEVAEAKQKLDDVKISQLDMLEAENAVLEEDIVGAREYFYPIMKSNEIDKMLTGTALEYNLYAYDLLINISDTEADTSAYQYSEKAIQEKYEEEMASEEADAADSSANQSTYDELDTYLYGAEESSASSVSTGIYVATVSMRVGGDPEDMQRLINDLSVPDKAMHITSYQWSRTRKVEYNDTSADYEVGYDTTLMITLDIYMCEE